MDKVNGKLTVFFEEPFWVGIFERIEDGKLSVAKITFGAEPKDYEVQEYIQKCYIPPHRVGAGNACRRRFPRPKWQHGILGRAYG